MSNLILANDGEGRNRTVLPRGRDRNRQGPELRIRSLRKSLALLIAALLPSIAVLWPLHGLASDVLPADAVAAQLRERLERVPANRGFYLNGLPVASGEVLAHFYADRGYRPVWTPPRRVDELFSLLGTAESHGLDPRDYYLEPLRRLHSGHLGVRDPAMAADLDLLLTESLIRFGYHQRFGKVNPGNLVPTWNFTRQYRPGLDPEAVLRAALEAPSLEEFLGEWIRRVPLYRKLQDALAGYRAIAAAGGWPATPEGPTLRPGDRDVRVPVVRERLQVTGDVPAAQTEDPLLFDQLLFDEALADGLRAFQARHGLDTDGVLGSRTLAAMNVPVTARIDQLRMTLERARWVLDDTADDAVIVNIAGYEVFVWREGRVSWWRRAVVGRVVRQTPVFKGSMTYIDLNPTWTVPPTILREDVLPKVRRDPGYLRANDMSVLDSAGRKVDPASVDWAALGNRIPYTIRQEPGPDNALGRIKFMFPNPHAVFLHDTPSRQLFDRAERSFSSGCIRVEDPLALAEIVLGDPAKWNRATLEAAIATGRTQTIRLPRPWPVLVLYWTAELDGEGRVRFLNDVYGRDPALLRALNGEVVLDFPDAEDS